MPVEKLYDLCEQAILERCGYLFVKKFKVLTKELPLQIRYHLAKKFEFATFGYVFFDPPVWKKSFHSLYSQSAKVYVNEYIDTTMYRVHAYLYPLRKKSFRRWCHLNAELMEHIAHEIDCHCRKLFSATVHHDEKMSNFLKLSMSQD
jgi:hypothetical protein